METDNEVAKREALVEALTTFCNVVRKTRRNSSEVPELLNSAGKLSMEHIIPIYRVSKALSELHQNITDIQSGGLTAACSMRSILLTLLLLHLALGIGASKCGEWGFELYCFALCHKHSA